MSYKKIVPIITVCGVVFIALRINSAHDARLYDQGVNETTLEPVSPIKITAHALWIRPIKNFFIDTYASLLNPASNAVINKFNAAIGSMTGWMHQKFAKYNTERISLPVAKYTNGYDFYKAMVELQEKHRLEALYKKYEYIPFLTDELVRELEEKEQQRMGAVGIRYPIQETPLFIKNDSIQGPSAPLLNSSNDSKEFDVSIASAVFKKDILSKLNTKGESIDSDNDFITMELLPPKELISRARTEISKLLIDFAIGQHPAFWSGVIHKVTQMFAAPVKQPALFTDGGSSGVDDNSLRIMAQMLMGKAVSIVIENNGQEGYLEYALPKKVLQNYSLYTARLLKILLYKAIAVRSDMKKIHPNEFLYRVDLLTDLYRDYWYRLIDHIAFVNINDRSVLLSFADDTEKNTFIKEQQYLADAIRNNLQRVYTIFV